MVTDRTTELVMPLDKVTLMQTLTVPIIVSHLDPDPNPEIEFLHDIVVHLRLGLGLGLGLGLALGL